MSADAIRLGRGSIRFAGVGRLRRTVSAEQQPQQQERSLYRRHRPRSFAEVVGQEPVVRTLRNAVSQGKVHHAYLFVGSRGTGKTSMAKILAACLNCEHGPTVDPCGTCQSCLSIASATSLDVIEMDAASNNSVDDIRELRESVAFAPVSGRGKVYILDEAHMLSTAAWNAFLKTLEEPPPSTVFVLATTEAGKVPATVVDRCHRFDFHRPTVEQIASVVRRAAEAEGISIPAPAVAALARSATGSFRDALGTLEQLVTYSGPEIALDDVLAVLGVADSRLLAETVDAVAACDARRALTALAGSVDQGRDAASFASDLEVRCRELLVVQALGEVPQELALTDEADSALAEQAGRVDHGIVVRLLELLGDAMEAVRAGADPRTRLELALVKAARPELDNSLKALLARIERLERGGAPHVPAPAPPQAPAAAQQQPSVPTLAPPAEGGGEDGGGGTAAPGPGAVSPISPAAPALQGEQTQEPQAGAAKEPDTGTFTVGSPDDGDWLGSIRSLWPAVVDLVRGEHAMLGALIADARPVELEGDNLLLAFEPAAQLFKKKAEDPDNRAIVGAALQSVTGSRWKLSYELREEAPEIEAPGEQTEERRVARFMEEFDAEEIPVEALTSNEKGD
jgi:DNA polymerase III subunit gamma/tau